MDGHVVVPPVILALLICPLLISAKKNAEHKKSETSKQVAYREVDSSRLSWPNRKPERSNWMGFEGELFMYICITGLMDFSWDQEK